MILLASLLLSYPLPQDTVGAGPPPGAGVIESSTCALCHSNVDTATAMRDANGVGIAPFDLWSGTMMANSTRDPLWRAAVAAEVAGTPAAREAIERKCLSCHAPMASRFGIENTPPIHVLHDPERIGDLAREGVSCTICHGIVPDELGTPESYTAGFTLDPWRRLFGPHEEPFFMPMRRFSGFTPTHGLHILDSGLCGSCHTLETKALTAEGEETGHTLLEQAPFLEWRNSVYHGQATCQDCHVPTHDASGTPHETRIVRNPAGRNFPPTRPRTPFGRHRFVGANTMVLELLRDHAADLGVTADPSSLDAAAEAVRDQLTNRSARVTILDPVEEAGRLRFDVRVENLAGHKLPTAHPSRRAWLAVIVRDERGDALFASGIVDERGRIVGPDGRPLPHELAGGPVPPHRDRITSMDQVPLYRAILADSNGEPTHLLLRGASYHTDDRLLPRGWRADGPDAERTKPVGFEDDDFTPGTDVVTYDLKVNPDSVSSIEAVLVHQSYSARWAAELFRFDAPDVERFAALYETANPRPNVLARATHDMDHEP